MSKVYVVGGGFQYERMFKEHGHRLVDRVAEADVMCFTGGADVSPHLYGEKNVASHVNVMRDVEEDGFFAYGKFKGLPMVGICRGGQLLNVMSGGRMWQDVDNHAIGGTHVATCVHWGDVNVTSTHHQMMRPSDKGEIMVSSNRASYKLDQDGEHKSDGLDVEVVYYRHTNSLCYQPHPEIVKKDHECRKHFMFLFDKLVKGEL